MDFDSRHESATAKTKRELKERGYTVQETTNGHYWVIKANGGKLINFAVGHGRNKGLVLDNYVNDVRKAINADR